MFFKTDEILDLLKPDGGKLKVASSDEAFDYCRRIAKRHYENFPVGSLVVPRKLRKHFYSVYAYSRLADDIADEFAEINDQKQLAIEMLEKLAENASNRFDNHDGNPIFFALSETMKELGLPPKPFINLTVAFVRDINFRRAESIDDLFNYCYYSANPVGEIVLRLFGEYNAENAKLSDKICTALQFANFWQDISVDMQKNRIYLPVKNFPNIELNDLLQNKKNIILHDDLNVLYNLTYQLFNEGKQLIKKVKSNRLKFELKMIVGGGLKILSKVNRLEVDIVSTRPTLNKNDIVGIFLKSLF